MISTGQPGPLGASPDQQGTNFALYSSGAERVELCLFDAAGQPTASYTLPECSDGVWYGYMPGCKAGQLYGYRVHGPYAPADGLRYNPHKLLIDPYARLLSGELRWDPAVFDYMPGSAATDLIFNPADSAPFVPKCVVVGPMPAVARKRACASWSDTIIYELNVRGYTMRHPAIPEAERGRFAGLRNGQILDYLRALGITAVELMPVQAFVDEQALQQRGLRNLWGYNTINFFAPANRYAGADAISEFHAMVNAIHDANMEVILDVAYNHTGESDFSGPTLSFRGIDNLVYYRTMPDNPAEYINDTGCGNTLNSDHPVAQQLVTSSLRYWTQQLGVDGFRFDLATILGRDQAGFSHEHTLLQTIESDPDLAGLKLIAEPWDPGPGGYQLGSFSVRWGEWNDRYRDSVRRFWRGDEHQASELAQRLHGSADIFAATQRQPAASINFVASHDGFTLADTVAFAERHNLANGEGNRDGHGHNYSCNYGVEGATNDAAIVAVRRRQRLNILATLLLSSGTPMLLAGDEFGNSQGGNNNAYAQDNATGWVDWSGLESDPEFAAVVQTLIQLRLATPLLNRIAYPHGHTQTMAGWPDIAWLRPDGEAMRAEDWQQADAFTLLLVETDGHARQADHAVAILLNRSAHSVNFALPTSPEGVVWELRFSSCGASPAALQGPDWHMQPGSVACIRLPW